VSLFRFCYCSMLSSVEGPGLCRRIGLDSEGQIARLDQSLPCKASRNFSRLRPCSGKARPQWFHVALIWKVEAWIGLAQWSLKGIHKPGRIGSTHPRFSQNQPPIVWHKCGSSGHDPRRQ
jgi:hypothetical protein